MWKRGRNIFLIALVFMTMEAIIIDGEEGKLLSIRRYSRGRRQQGKEI
jgi:hypothetical protein